MSSPWSIFRFGTAKDLMGTTSVAQLTGSMLMRGTKNKTRQQIQDEIDRLKARINVSGGPTGASATIETTEANLAGALKLAAEILPRAVVPGHRIGAGTPAAHRGRRIPKE